MQQEQSELSAQFISQQQQQKYPLQVPQQIAPVISLLHKSPSSILSHPQYCLPEPPLTFSSNQTLTNLPVCAKILIPGQLIVQCYECRADRTCVICMDCFKNGKHQGHKYVIRAAGGGCCDCGDREAWKETGFCSKHSGKRDGEGRKDKKIAKEENLLKIDQVWKKKFKARFQVLMVIYFYERIIIKDEMFSIKLVENLKRLCGNAIGVKVLGNVLSQKLKFKINEKLDKNTILENILNFYISDALLDEWLTLFMLLFSNYQFKIDLITAYIHQFGNLITGSQTSFRCAGSYSCQLLSSHQLLTKFSQSSKTGLGHGYLPPSMSQLSNSIPPFRRYYLRLLYDLTYINKLPISASYSYWKMHINSPFSITNILSFYDYVIGLGKTLRQAGVGNNGILVRSAELMVIEEEILCCFLKIMGIIKGGPKEGKKQVMEGEKEQFGLIGKIGRILLQGCEKYAQQGEEFMTIFRCYERCFGVFIFGIFQCSYDGLQGKIKKLLKQVLKISYNRYRKVQSIMMKKMLQTYFFYSKIIAQPGLGQSLYMYSYFYKTKYHMLSSIDIMICKLLVLQTSKDLQINFQAIINFQQAQPTEQDPNPCLQQSYLKQKKLHLSSILAFLKYLYTFSISQIILTNQLNSNNFSATSSHTNTNPKTNKLYHNELFDLLQRYFFENKGSVSIDKMNLFKNKVFGEGFTIIDQWLKQNCTVNKQKKIFVIDNKKIKQKYMNIGDIWQSTLQQNFTFIDPFKTIQCISSSNQKILHSFYNKATIVQLAQILPKLYKPSQCQGIQLILSNILPVYLIKKQSKQMELASIIKDKILIPYLNGIPTQYREKIQQLNLKIKQIQIQEKANEQDEKQRRKTKLEQIKSKKMQKMKMNQQKFLLQNMDQQQILHKKSSQSYTPNEQQQLLCLICRSDAKQKLVYLYRMQLRNHEKLLQIHWKGINCPTFNTCFHTFCYQCVQKKYRKQQEFFRIKCPLCKNWCQILVPVQGNKADKAIETLNTIGLLENVYNDQISSEFQEFSLIAQQKCNYKKKEGQKNEETQQVHLFKQMLKCIYHFILLCFAERKIYFSKRLRVYKKLIEIFIKIIKKKEIIAAYQKIGNYCRKQNYQIQEVQQQMLKPKRNAEKQQELPQIKTQFPPLKKQIKKKSQIQIHLKKKSTKKQSQLQSQLCPKEKQRPPYIPLLESTIFSVFKYLFQKFQLGYPGLTHPLSSHPNFLNLSKFTNHLIKSIFSHQLSHEQTNSISTFTMQPQCLSLKQYFISPIFKQLPKLYSNLIMSQNRVCHYCQEIKNKLFLCLYCHWVVCGTCWKKEIKEELRNQQQKEKGSITKNTKRKDEQMEQEVETIMTTQRHTRTRHGMVIGTWMDIQNAIAFYEGNCGNGKVAVGQIYQDYWGKPILQNQKWEQIQLNNRMFRDIEEHVVGDRIIEYRNQ